MVVTGFQKIPEEDVNDYLVGMNRLQTDRGKKLEAGL